MNPDELPTKNTTVSLYMRTDSEAVEKQGSKTARTKHFQMKGDERIGRKTTICRTTDKGCLLL